jgi:hypothetical protein
MNVFAVAVSVFLLNIPFGYWRENVKRYSLQWVLSIHIPIPVIIVLRIYSGIGFQFYTYPIMVGVFFLGQLTGLHMYKWRTKNENLNVTGCLIMDIFRGRKQ